MGAAIGVGPPSLWSHGALIVRRATRPSWGDSYSYGSALSSNIFSILSWRCEARDSRSGEGDAGQRERDRLMVLQTAENRHLKKREAGSGRCAACSRGYRAKATAECCIAGIDLRI